jgi:hypothetical protein
VRLRDLSGKKVLSERSAVLSGRGG